MCTSARKRKKNRAPKRVCPGESLGGPSIKRKKEKAPFRIGEEKERAFPGASENTKGDPGEKGRPSTM